MRAHILKATVLTIILESPGLFCQPGALPDSTILSKVDTALKKLTRMHKEIRDMHPFLMDLHPIAVVEGGALFIFDVDSSRREYVFQRKEPVPFPMEKGIRASFPLASYGGKPTCVVSREVFDSTKGYATIFHEFVHCAQFLTCENKLKQGLQITQAALLAKDYSWEINHPFPYLDAEFVKSYSGELQALAHHDSGSVLRVRRELKRRLARIDYEYMVWVEWKEGFARFMENEIRLKYGIEANQAGKDPPFNRVAFYYGGEKLIRSLIQGHRERFLDVEELFKRMLDVAAVE